VSLKLMLICLQKLLNDCSSICSFPRCLLVIIPLASCHSLVFQLLNTSLQFRNTIRHEDKELLCREE
jgi:hypothetical protein